MQNSTGSKAGKRLWRKAIAGNVLALGLVSLFTDLSSEMIFPLIPVFLAGMLQSGSVAMYVGIMAGIAETTSSLLKIFSGRLSDALGKRKILVLGGYGISTIARPLMALATSGWHVVGLRFFDRIGKGIRTSPRDALIAMSIPSQTRGLAYSFHRAMDHAGAVAGPLVSIAVLYGFLGEVLWRSHSETVSGEEMEALRWLFGIALLPGLAAVLVIALLVREKDKNKATGSTRQAGTIAGRSRLSRRFYFYVGIVTLFAMGNSSDLFIVTYGKTVFGMSLLEIIGLWIALHVSKIIFSIPGGIISDKLDRRWVIAAGYTVYAAVYLGYAACAETWQFWALLTAYGFYYGLTEGVEKALVADMVPERRRATAFGVYHGAVGLAALPASIVFGVLWKAFGPGVAFGTGAALAGASTLLLLMLPKTEVLPDQT